MSCVYGFIAAAQIAIFFAVKQHLKASAGCDAETLSETGSMCDACARSCCVVIVIVLSVNDCRID